MQKKKCVRQEEEDLQAEQVAVEVIIREVVPLMQIGQFQHSNSDRYYQHNFQSRGSGMHSVRRQTLAVRTAEPPKSNDHERKTGGYPGEEHIDRQYGRDPDGRELSRCDRHDVEKCRFLQTRHECGYASEQHCYVANRWALTEWFR